VWRCGLIQRAPGMTERRCTVTVRKSAISMHVEKGPHIFYLLSENDQGFPPTRRLPASQFAAQQFAEQIDTATTLVAGWLDIPIQIVGTAQFQEFRLCLMQVGADIQRQYSGLNFAGIFQRPSAAHMSELLNHLGKKRYEEQVCLAVRDVKFVSMLCDAGTVNKLKPIHPMILNPSCLSSSIPLLARTNKSFTSDDYSQYFQDTCRVPIELRFEICGVLCDNLPPKSKD
jgi:hypothetical protein